VTDGRDVYYYYYYYYYGSAVPGKISHTIKRRATVLQEKLYGLTLYRIYTYIYTLQHTLQQIIRRIKAAAPLSCVCRVGSMVMNVQGKLVKW